MLFSKKIILIYCFIIIFIQGTDILKLIALGASCVFIGRPVLYANAVAGHDGVLRLVEILREELKLAMALLGKISIS